MSIDDNFTKVFLLHLGKKELCLVWSVQGFPKMKRVCCLAFCVSTEEGGKLQAKEQKFSSYPAKGKALVDCLAIKWASCNNVEPVGTSTISSFVVPAKDCLLLGVYVNRNWQLLLTYKPSVIKLITHRKTAQLKGVDPLMLPCQKEVTRHARRVYVGDLPTGADRQKIVFFFCGVISDIGAVTNPDLAVVDIHINREKNFAILEMISMALAINMMALDGIIFKGAPLRIRRPGDYNPGLAANLEPTQPSCYLKLEIITRKKFAANDQDTMLRRTMQALAWEASIPYSNGLDAGPSRVICLLEVFLEYSSIEESAKAMEGVIRKDFGYYKVILACYYPEDKYDEKDLNFLDEYINLKCT
ncbi:hypothetical protein IFM89_003135 [Coptis chinensis]|uniref:RRM domain-containing protein n=1 Tax=Coptis chinensis TaxID=261450 RepID=A0A835I6U7_9MAGN|nr:hypothetical protein IFM89_003135 [Coptis chinensis]